MSGTRFGILWKYFLIAGLITMAAAFIILFLTDAGQKNDVEQQAFEELQSFALLSASAADGSEIETLINEQPANAEALADIGKKIGGNVQNFLSYEWKFKIYRISILVPAGNAARVIYSSEKPVSLQEEVVLYPEMQEAMDKQGVELKKDYLERGKSLTSAFAPVLNPFGKVVGVSRVDMTGEEIAAMYPDFWGRLAMYIGIALLFSFLISFILSRLVIKPVNKFVSFVNKVSEGNYQLRYEDYPSDEMGKIANAINVMLEKLEGLIETEADRDRLQGQITSLLRIVSAAADGDFTVKAEVTADTLGALSDSFNLMVSELSGLIREVQKASEQIVESTGEILNSSEAMADGANNQAKEIESTYASVKNMADIIKYANDRSTQAAKAASRAAEVAQKGTEIVKSSIEGMHRIRDIVQETARQVQILGQNSQEIGEILEVISEIANRTNLLGLNATIEAARASESSRGFGVVADEVRGLAERSGQAAKDIAILVENIQKGTSEAVKAMKTATTEVDRETHKVDEAGSALKEILEMAQHSDSLIHEISESFQQQTTTSANIAKIMEKIADIAQETAERAKTSQTLSEEMTKSSGALSVAISRFRLPSRFKSTR
jgi:methyl-accepting chemotaxis protein